MANLVIYRTYPSGKSGRDPILDDVEEAIKKENLLKKPGVIRELSGVSVSTVRNWIGGKTRRPSYATVMAVFGALGYHGSIERSGRFDLDAERRDAKRWRLRQDAAKLAKQNRESTGRRTKARDNNASA